MPTRACVCVCVCVCVCKLGGEGRRKDEERRGEGGRGDRIATERESGRDGGKGGAKWRRAGPVVAALCVCVCAHSAVCLIPTPPRPGTSPGAPPSGRGREGPLSPHSFSPGSRHRLALIQFKPTLSRAALQQILLKPYLHNASRGTPPPHLP